MSGQIDRLMDGETKTGRCVCREVDGWTDAHRDREMDGQTKTNGYIDGQTEGPTDG